MKPVCFHCHPLESGRPGFYLVAERTDIDRRIQRYFGHATITTLGPALMPVLLADECARLERALLEPSGVAP